MGKQGRTSGDTSKVRVVELYSMGLKVRTCLDIISKFEEYPPSFSSDVCGPKLARDGDEVLAVLEDSSSSARFPAPIPAQPR
jgi:hypothetical protein